MVMAGGRVWASVPLCRAQEHRRTLETRFETFGLTNRQAANHHTLAQSRSDPSALNPATGQLVDDTA